MQQQPFLIDSNASGAMIVPWENTTLSLTQRIFGTLMWLLKQSPVLFNVLTPLHAKRVEHLAYVFVAVACFLYFGQIYYVFLPLKDTDIQSLFLARLPLEHAISIVRFKRLLLVIWCTSPVWSYAVTHILAGLYQITMSVFFLRSRDYEYIYKATSYGVLWPMLILPLPILGPLMAIVWMFMLHAIALSVVYRLPLLLGFVGVFLAWGVLLSTLMALVGKVMALYLMFGF